MRNSFRKLKQDGKNVLEQGDITGSQNGDRSQHDPAKASSENYANGVGDIADIGEFGLGVAARDSRPVVKIELSKEKEAEIAEAQRYVEDAESVAEEDMGSTQALFKAAKQKNNIKKRKPVDKQAAFLEFKQEEAGRQLEDSIRDNRGELKTIKVTVKELTEQCNDAKHKLDKVKAELDKKQDERREGMQNQLAEDEDADGDEGPQEIIDEDELALLQKMKELKKAYRASYANLKGVKAQVALISQAIDQSKQRLVADFEGWYVENFEEDGAQE